MAARLQDIDSPESEKIACLAEKKPYRPPILTPLGSLREITLSAGNSGASDGGKVGFRFTKRGGNFEATTIGL